MTKRRPPTPEEITAGRRLSEAMTAAGYDQARFAHEFNVSPGLISQWVNATVRMPYKHAENAARLLNCRPEDISVEYRKLPRKRGSHLEVRELDDVGTPAKTASSPNTPDDITGLTMAVRSLTAILSSNAPIAAMAFADHLEDQAEEKNVSTTHGIVAQLLRIVRANHPKKASARTRA